MFFQRTSRVTSRVKLYANPEVESIWTKHDETPIVGVYLFDVFLRMTGSDHPSFWIVAKRSKRDHRPLQDHLLRSAPVPVATLLMNVPKEMHLPRSMDAGTVHVGAVA